MAWIRGRHGRERMDKNDSKRGCGCPVFAFQRMMSGKYKARILWDLKDGARRYGEIQKGLLRGGAAALTPLGRSFVPVIDRIRLWGSKHLVAA